MDGINLIRIIFTVLSFVCFLLIAFWAYSKTSKKQFDEAANLPFADDDPKTAEVVAKVILLARDELIRDPTILEQIVR